MKEFLTTVAQLGDHQHLNREKALERIGVILQESTPDKIGDMTLIMISMFRSMLNSRRWEDRFGAINGILAVVQHRAEDNEQDAELD